MKAIAYAALVLALRIPFLRAANPAYTFTIVAKTGDTIGGRTLEFLGEPWINNKGEIVFDCISSTPLTPSRESYGVCTPTTTLVATPVTISGRTLYFVSHPLINDGGAVV